MQSDRKVPELRTAKSACVDDSITSQIKLPVNEKKIVSFDSFVFRLWHPELWSRFKRNKSHNILSK